MKKPVRHIRVEGETYAWQVRTHEDESGIPYTKIKIWGADKELIHEISLAYEITITPGQIAGLLKHNRQILK